MFQIIKEHLQIFLNGIRSLDEFTVLNTILLARFSETKEKI